MYSAEVITKLNDRLGWLQTSEPDFGFILSPENLISNSGRNFQWFHFSVSLTSILHCQDNENMTEDEFNQYLVWLKNQCILSVLSQCFSNPKCEISRDYSGEINAYSSLFDDAIGYAMAIQVIEMCISSTRSNKIERIGKENYGKFKSELEGYFSTNKLVVKGLRHKYNDAVEKASNLLCGKTGIIGIFNGTNNW